MATQVLRTPINEGFSRLNVSYTNNTGQNVRIIINYVRCSAFPLNGGFISQTMSWKNGELNSKTVNLNIGFEGASNISNTIPGLIFGRNVCYFKRELLISSTSQNMVVLGSAVDTTVVPSTVRFTPLPTEIMISNGGTFSLSNVFEYEILVITES